MKGLNKKSGVTESVAGARALGALRLLAGRGRLLALTDTVAIFIDSVD